MQKTIDTLKSSNESLNVVITQQTKDIKTLLNPYADSVSPTWLNEGQMPYIPSMSLPEGTVTIEDPREIYCSNEVLKKLVKEAVKNMTLDQKLTWVWYQVIDRLTYMYDVTEDWQPPIISWYKRQADCEDGTILFIEMCKLAGIKPDNPFNRCGWYDKKYGHSYPTAVMLDGKTYIFETTIDYHPSAPILFEGSKYDDSWGVCNWHYMGKNKNTNSVSTMSKGTGIILRNYENDLFKDLDEKANAEKMKSINSYWKGKK